MPSEFYQHLCDYTYPNLTLRLVWVLVLKKLSGFSKPSAICICLNSGESIQCLCDFNAGVGWQSDSAVAISLDLKKALRGFLSILIIK